MSLAGLESWGVGTVWVTYRSAATGALLPGLVTVHLPVRLTSPTEDAIIPSGTLIKDQPLDLFGLRSFEALLPATDDLDITPNDWGYTITVSLENGVSETFKNVVVPEGGSVNLRLYPVGV